MNRYFLGDFRLPMLTMRQDVQDSNLIGIGGDLGDVFADSAECYEDGVILINAILMSSKENLSPASQQELAEEIVYSAYESIEDECFGCR